MLSRNFISELKKYVENHLSEIKYDLCIPMQSYKNICNEEDISELEDFININQRTSFTQLLFEFIDKNKISDAEIYKKAEIDRRLFSKIRSNINYHPGKNTVIALALALELNKTETDYLLSSAGYTLSESSTFDLVIKFCINKKIYNLQTVNEALDYFSLKPLGTIA